MTPLVASSFAIDARRMRRASRGIASVRLGLRVMRGRRDPKDLRVLPARLGPRVSGGRQELGDPVLPDPRDLPVRKVPPDLLALMAHRARRASRGRKGLRDPQVRPGPRVQQEPEGSTWTTPPEQ